MKRFLSGLIAVLMLMQMFTFTVSAASAPATVCWTGEYPGELMFTLVNGVDEYRIIVYKDNSIIDKWTHHTDNYYEDELYFYLLEEILGNGNGTYRVEVGSSNGNGGYTFKSSENFVYKKPSVSLAKATNIKFDAKNYIVTWNAVPGAEFYEVVLGFTFDTSEGMNPYCTYRVDSGNYFDFYEDGPAEFEWLYEEIEWEAEYEGLDPDDAIIGISVNAMVNDINVKTPSFSDYVTLDGKIIPNDGSDTSGGGSSGTGTAENLAWGDGVGLVSFMPVGEDVKTCIISLYKDEELVDYLEYEIADYEFTFGVEYYAFRETIARLGNGEYQFSVIVADENYESLDGKELFSDIYVHKVLEQVDRSSITEGKYADGAKIAYDLGLMTNVYENPTANITKGELCEIVVKMLGAEDIAKQYNDATSPYTDVQTGTDLNGYVKYVQDQSILSGDDTGAFGVATEMTYEQIIKVLVSLLGFEPYAQKYGGYLTVASRYKITGGMALATGSTVTREQMAVLAANAMEAQTLEVESYTINGTKYKVSDESLLFKNGYSKIIGIGYADENTLTIDSGTLKDIDNLTGKEVTELDLKNYDYDILALNGKESTYYVKDGKALSGILNYSASVVINNGDAETSNTNVRLTLNANGYTKYKIEDGDYSPITSTVSYTLPSIKHGSQTVNVTFANDDETRTQKVSDSISFNNIQKITYMANGRVFKTVEVGCGCSVPSMTEIPSITGYRFDGWETSAPSVMPDNDIVINAKLTPITTITGAVTVNGTPVSGAKVWIGDCWYAQTDANGAFSFDMERGHHTATVKYENMSKAVFCDLKDVTLDLGEITLKAESTEIKVTEQSIASVSGAEELFDEEDKEYIKTEGNVVAVKIDVVPASENTNITQKENETNYQVATLVDIDITKVKSGAETSQTQITQTNELLEIKFVVPEESKGKASYVILREHDGVVDVLTTVPNADGEYIVINQDVIVVYAKKFSTYALATKEVVSATKTDTGVSFEIKLNEQVVIDNAIMIVKAYNKRGVQLASKAIPVTASYSDTVTLTCEGATDYKLLFFKGLANIKPVYSPINGSL